MKNKRLIFYPRELPCCFSFFLLCLAIMCYYLCRVFLLLSNATSHVTHDNDNDNLRFILKIQNSGRREEAVDYGSELNAFKEIKLCWD